MANTIFQQAVKKDVSRDRRTDAISTLIERRDARNLTIIVRMGGLSGTFRRQALEGLARCENNGRERLAGLADDQSIAPSLRDRATELA
jgi:hypothetical protein